MYHGMSRSLRTSDDFVLPVLSDSSGDIFADNTLSQFTVILPETIVLEGEYEVGLLELIINNPLRKEDSLPRPSSTPTGAAVDTPVGTVGPTNTSVWPYAPKVGPPSSSSSSTSSRARRPRPSAPAPPPPPPSDSLVLESYQHHHGVLEEQNSREHAQGVRAGEEEKKKEEEDDKAKQQQQQHHPVVPPRASPPSDTRASEPVDVVREALAPRAGLEAPASPPPPPPQPVARQQQEEEEEGEEGDTSPIQTGAAAPADPPEAAAAAAAVGSSGTARPEAPARADAARPQAAASGTIGPQAAASGAIGPQAAASGAIRPQAAASGQDAPPGAGRPPAPPPAVPAVSATPREEEEEGEGEERSDPHEEVPPRRRQSIEQITASARSASLSEWVQLFKESLQDNEAEMLRLTNLLRLGGLAQPEVFERFIIEGEEVVSSMTQIPHISEIKFPTETKPSVDEWLMNIAQCLDNESQPVNSVSPRPTQIMFYSPAMPGVYCNLKGARLKLTLQMVDRTEGEQLTAQQNTCGVVCNIGDSLFSHMNLAIGEKETVSHPENYAYKCIMQLYSRATDEALKTNLAMGLCDIDEDASTTVSNAAWANRKSPFALSKKVEIITRIKQDIFNIKDDLFLLDNLSMRFTFELNREEFYLWSSTSPAVASLNILDAVLLLPFFRVNPELSIAVDATLQKSNARYPFKSCQVKSFLCPSNTQQIIVQNAYAGQLPSLFVLSLVKTTDFQGTVTTNPFNFITAGVTRVSIFVNNVEHKFDADFTREMGYTEAYASVGTALGLDSDDMGSASQITLKRYKNGQFFIMLDTTADGSGNAGAAMNLPQMGNLSIECQLAAPLDYSITVLCMGEFDSMLEVDSNRQVHVLLFVVPSSERRTGHATGDGLSAARVSSTEDVRGPLPWRRYGQSGGHHAKMWTLLVLLALCAASGIQTEKPPFKEIYGDAVVTDIAELTETQPGVAFAESTAVPAFHQTGVWVLEITMPRVRSAAHVRAFLDTLRDIAWERCPAPPVAASMSEFCDIVATARNESIIAFMRLFSDQTSVRIDEPANTTMSLPEYVFFYETGVADLWRELGSGPRQSVFAERVILKNLGYLIRSKVSCLTSLADEEHDMWTDMLVHSTAPSGYLLSCSALRDAYAFAASMLPPGLSFERSLSCTGLPPVHILRSATRLSVRLYLSTGVTCADLLAFPIPVIYNETHMFGLTLSPGAAVPCVVPPGNVSSELLCALNLYHKGKDTSNNCSLGFMPAEYANIVSGVQRVIVVSVRHVSIVFKYKANGSSIVTRARIQGRKSIDFTTNTNILLKGLNIPRKIVKITGYVGGCIVCRQICHTLLLFTQLFLFYFFNF
ncbi:hypothetical protein KUF71_011829 [Frankliniella fusca]|uniref:Uncharacterized protein n=1 Tax=Frankliniella fusca TaxID=407009 RepID=A0AAE1HJ82_9NEOP|nr:hypothetical protein KUF71_011829 [Frankliniella fusca]